MVFKIAVALGQPSIAFKSLRLLHIIACSEFTYKNIVKSTRKLAHETVKLMLKLGTISSRFFSSSVFVETADGNFH